MCKISEIYQVKGVMVVPLKSYFITLSLAVMENIICVEVVNSVDNQPFKLKIKFITYAVSVRALVFPVVVVVFSNQSQRSSCDSTVMTETATLSEGSLSVCFFNHVHLSVFLYDCLT